MAFAHKILHQWSSSGRSISAENEYEGESQSSVDENVADSETDKELTFTLDVSACKSFIILSDQDVTIETNNAGPDPAPDDTLSLVAGVPYIWNTDSLDTFLLTVDVTALFVTNASGSTARIQIEALTDPTP